MNQRSEPTATAGVLHAKGEPRFDAALAGNTEQAWMTLADSEPAQLAKVGGGFAVAVQRADGAIWMAVDRFAVETLCWRIEDGVLRIATRADQLGAEQIEAQALFDYLHFHAIPSPHTVFSGVQRLPAGHWALFKDGKIEVKPFWKPDFRPQAKPDFVALKEEFRRLVQQGVKRSLGNHKAACFLSGGTDSSTVAGMLARLGGSKPDSYSIGFEAEGYDEMEYARLAAKHFGTNHHEYYVTADDLVREIPHVAAAIDQPFGNSSLLPAFCCAKLAHSDGVTRLLAGDGGDELFGGNARYAKQRVFGWYQNVPGFLRAGLLEPLLMHTPLGTLPLARKGRSYIEQAGTPMPDRLDLYNLLTRIGRGEVLTPEFLARVDQAEPLGLQRQVWNSVPEANELDRQLAFDWRFTLAESDLPKVRQACLLAGVEVGFPLLDDDLLAFSLLLPEEYKLKGNQLRWFFKEALRGFLPDEIITKSKHGFGLPFGVWCTRHAALRELAESSVQGLVGRGWVRADFARRLFAELLPAHPGYYGEMVWILMMLEQWLQAHSAAGKPVSLV